MSVQERQDERRVAQTQPGVSHRPDQPVADQSVANRSSPEDLIDTSPQLQVEFERAEQMLQAEIEQKLKQEFEKQRDRARFD